MGEPYFDYGVDAIINYLESGYNLNGTQSNGIFNENESIISDTGIDGCFDQYEDGDGGCLTEANSDYDATINPDPNNDNFLEDINQDNWNDCGSDGVCSDTNPDDDGSEGNGIWDTGEGLERNNQMDWIESDDDLIIEVSDTDFEKWYDYGLDNYPDSLEFLQAGNYLQSNVISDINSYINFSLNDTLIDYTASNSFDNSKDLSMWISKIITNPDNLSYDVEIEFSANLAFNALEFDLSHFLHSYQDSLLNDFTSILYGSSLDTIIHDQSFYDIDNFEDSDELILDFSNDIKINLEFDLLNSFLNQDSTVFISTDDSNLFLNFKDRTDFNEGYSDIYYDGLENDIFLKRVYFDDENKIVVPIGNLLQKFIDKEFEYDGINLKLSGGGYNFNRLNFHNYLNLNSDECGYVGCADSLNPRIEVLFSKWETLQFY